MPTKYTAVIVDDEPKAIELLEDNLAAFFPTVQLIEKFTSWEPAFQRIKKDNFDLLFLDINLPEKSGLDILHLLPPLSCEIILITAYAEYALEAFKHNAAGYILKPIDDKFFIQTLDKCLERIDNKQKHNNNSAHLIAVPSLKGIDYIDIDSIRYFEAKNRYTNIATKDTKILSSYNIGYFLKALQQKPTFLQIHRSFIVNIKFVKRYNNDNTITLTNGSILPLSKSFKKYFLDSLG